MSLETQTQKRLLVVAACFFVPAALLVVGASVVDAHRLTAQDVAALAILGLLAVLSTNLDVEMVSRVAVSGVAMIFVASLVVFEQYGLIVGPAIVGALGAIDLSHVRRREWYKIVINGSADAMALLVAALVFSLLPIGSQQSTLWIVIGATLSALTYSVVNSMLVAVPVSVATGQAYHRALHDTVSFSVGSFPFALLGLGLGWVYLEFGATVVPLLVVPIMIARRSFASYLELQASQEQTIETLILALEAKDPYTSGHARRVAMFAEYVGEELGFGPRRMERLRYAALMHDIGKLIVPNQLLNKPGRLTEAEFERVKRHEPVSVELLRRIDFLAPVAGDTTTEAAEAAVKGDAELIEPAVIHVADAFDAMTSTRSYRRALSQETAFSELRNGSGKQFNTQAVEALIHAIERRGEEYGAGHEVEEHDWAVAPPEAGTGSAGLGDFVAEEQVAGT